MNNFIKEYQKGYSRDLKIVSFGFTDFVKHGNFILNTEDGTFCILESELLEDISSKEYTKHSQYKQFRDIEHSQRYFKTLTVEDFQYGFNSLKENVRTYILNRLTDILEIEQRNSKEFRDECFKIYDMVDKDGLTALVSPENINGMADSFGCFDYPHTSDYNIEIRNLKVNKITFGHWNDGRWYDEDDYKYDKGEAVNISNMFLDIDFKKSNKENFLFFRCNNINKSYADIGRSTSIIKGNTRYQLVIAKDNDISYDSNLNNYCLALSSNDNWGIIETEYFTEILNHIEELSNKFISDYTYYEPKFDIERYGTELEVVDDKVALCLDRVYLHSNKTGDVNLTVIPCKSKVLRKVTFGDKYIDITPIIGIRRASKIKDHFVQEGDAEVPMSVSMSISTVEDIEVALETLIQYK